MMGQRIAVCVGPSLKENNMIEYIVKVGGMFCATKFSRYSNNIILDPRQLEAARYDEETLTETINFMILHNVPYQVYKIDGKAEAITFVPVKSEVKETV